MAEPICEDEGLLQEWAPETKLLQQIPLRVQRGLFSYDLNLTCIDVVPEYLAVGTNCGLVYWYCRATSELQRLKFENPSGAVTCVKVVSTVDYMVAAGTDRGTVTVFQIPKMPPEGIPAALKTKNKEVERFTINGLHKAYITAIEWSQNGMKLFSGDRNGMVVVTEIDFYMHISKSTELLNEQFEIVQLSYGQQILLISTLFRSIICDGNDKWKVHQVGTKERKTLGKFGATLCKFSHGLVIYASRPGHRIWLADKSGSVQQTLIFKSAVPSTHPKIPLINPYNKAEPYDTSFGKLVQFGDNKLIAYNSEILYVLHPGAISVVSSLDCARKILDVAVNEHEIFVLEGKRSVIRISHAPDNFMLDIKSPSTSRRTSFIFDEFAAKLKDTAVGSIKKITSDLIITPEQTSPPALADEAMELPPIVNLPQGSVSSIIPNTDVEVHVSLQDGGRWNSSSYCVEPVRKISQVSATGSTQTDGTSANDEEYSDELVARPAQRRHRRKNRRIQGQESESDTTSTTSEDRLVWGIANDFSVSEESPPSQSQSSYSVIPSLSNRSGANQDDTAKTPDDKSQASIDTCESVSEHLVLTPERFQKEQKLTFERLANPEMLDSYNSEKTEDMSISTNMTPSSSVSSKISDNLQSTSEISENVSMISDTKTDDSQTNDNSKGDLPLPKNLCFYRENGFECDNASSQDGKLAVSTETSVSSGNSQRVDHKLNFFSVPNPQEGSSSKLDGVEEYKLPVNVVPDLRSLETIRNDNEMILSQILGVDLTSLDSHKVRTSRDSESNNEPVKVTSDESACDVEDDTLQVGSVETVAKCLLGTHSDACECDSNEVGDHAATFSHDHNDLLPESEQQENHFRVSHRSLYDVDDKLDAKKESDIINKRFSLLGPLSYGPPSGSSMSSAPSLEYSCVPNIMSSSQLQLIEKSDHWIQYKTPEPVTNVAVCSNYVVCVDVNEQVYYSDLSGLALSWTPLDYKASMVSLSNDANIVWVLDRRTLFALVNPSKKGPFSESTLEADWNVRSFAVDSVRNEGWIVKPDGQMKRQKNLARAPCGKNEDVECQWLVTTVACHNGLVLALTSDEKLICRVADKKDFKSVETPCSIIKYIALGPGDFAWIVDDRNNVYFSDNILDENPYWWQILICDYIFQNSPSTFENIHSKIRLNSLRANIQLKSTMIATSEHSIWVFDGNSSTINVNKTDFTGYNWERIRLSMTIPHVKWETLCAEGVFEDKGHLWLLSAHGDLFCTKPDSCHFQSISPPCEDHVSCITSSTDTLWVLSLDGRIYSRLGLTEKNLTGNSWRELNLPQIADLRLTWVSCGCDVAWGCDVIGRVYITIGSPHQMATNIFDAAWLEVDGSAKEGAQFHKVFVGLHLHMVWAIDNKCNIYVREGIFSEYPIGTGWVYVAGIKAVHLTVSSTAVWALSAEGKIYRRYGISENNYIGDYWKRIPGNLQMLTSSFTDELWGINHEHAIVRLSHKTHVLSKRFKERQPNDTVSSSDDGDWELVEQS